MPKIIFLPGYMCVQILLSFLCSVGGGGDIFSQMRSEKDESQKQSDSSIRDDCGLKVSQLKTNQGSFRSTSSFKQPASKKVQK